MESKNYKYNGAKVLVELHEKHLREFVTVWFKAYESNLTLPSTNDPDYKSIESLLIHILRSSGNYLSWICTKLELPAPEIFKIPEPERVIHEVADYVNQLIKEWKKSINDVDEIEFNKRTYTTYWGVEMTIESMLEHAVMHPLRHSYQLNRLMNQK